MKFTAYLADRKFSIIAYVLLMGFITLVIVLDGTLEVRTNSLLYIHVVSAVFFIGYLIARYLYDRSYYKGLAHLVDHERDEFLNRLPKPRSNEQILFSTAI